MLSLLLQTQKYDKNFKLLDQKAYIAQSFVINFLHALYTRMSGVSSGSSTHGYILLYSPQGYGDSQLFARSTTGFDGDTLGILVGSNYDPTSWNQSDMDTIINHGTDTGELEYFGGNATDVTYDGDDAYFDMERIFRNSSGSTVTVKEFGLQGFVTTSAQALYARDSFSDAGDWAVVDDGEYLKVTYRIKITV